MLSRGSERWHPNPEMFYKAGGGPLFDFGPYYLTALLQILGPIKRVSAAAAIAIPQRTITSEPLRGKTFTVETPDHVSGAIEFANGCVATMVLSFAVMRDSFCPITIFGTEGTLRVPDPNRFDGDVTIRNGDDDEWKPVEQTYRTGYGRSVGVADMAHAIRSSRLHRASGMQAFVVLDAMEATLESAESGSAVDLPGGYQRPAPLPEGLPEDALD